jgi:hypothetical protein
MESCTTVLSGQRYGLSPQGCWRLVRCKTKSMVRGILIHTVLPTERQKDVKIKGCSTVVFRNCQFASHGLSASVELRPRDGHARSSSNGSSEAGTTFVVEGLLVGDSSEPLGGAQSMKFSPANSSLGGFFAS